MGTQVRARVRARVGPCACRRSQPRALVCQRWGGGGVGCGERRGPGARVGGGRVVRTGLVLVPLFEMLLELGNGNGTAEVLVVPAGPQAAEACVRVGCGAACAALRVWRRRRRGGDSCQWRCGGAAARWRGGVAAWRCGAAAAYSAKRSNRIRISFFEYLRAGRNAAGQRAAPVVWCAAASGLGVGRRLTLRCSASA